MATPALLGSRGSTAAQHRKRARHTALPPRGWTTLGERFFHQPSDTCRARRTTARHGDAQGRPSGPVPESPLCPGQRRARGTTAATCASSRGCTAPSVGPPQQQRRAPGARGGRASRAPRSGTGPDRLTLTPLIPTMGRAPAARPAPGGRRAASRPPASATRAGPGPAAAPAGCTATRSRRRRRARRPAPRSRPPPAPPAAPSRAASCQHAGHANSPARLDGSRVLGPALGTAFAPGTA